MQDAIQAASELSALGGGASVASADPDAPENPVDEIAENLAATPRHRGLVRLVLRNKATPDDDLGLEFYISSSRSRLAQGRCHLEQRRAQGCPSCGRPAKSDRAAWPTVTSSMD